MCYRNHFLSKEDVKNREHASEWRQAVVYMNSGFLIVLSSRPCASVKLNFKRLLFAFLSTPTFDEYIFNKQKA